jgi:hypothetical protein
VTTDIGHWEVQVKKFLTGAVVVLSLVIAAPALAADPTTSGTATIANGVATLTSDYTDTSTTNDAGALTFSVPTGTTLSSLTTLSAQYNITDGSCGGGSPRFQLNIDGKNVFVYLGPTPNFTGCASGWTSTGNLATNTELRVDLSQYGGAQYSTWAQAVALLGSHAVTGIDFAVDGGWSQTGKKQVVQVENVTINGTTYLVPTPPTTGKANPAKLCAAQRTQMGSAAFNELWGTNANQRNAFGKCVSSIAHARNAGQTQDQILAAISSCSAKGLKGGALGSCVAANDGVAATLTESQEAKHSATSHRSDHGKHKGHH